MPLAVGVELRPKKHGRMHRKLLMKNVRIQGQQQTPTHLLSDRVNSCLISQIYLREYFLVRADFSKLSQGNF